MPAKRTPASTTKKKATPRKIPKVAQPPAPVGPPEGVELAQLAAKVVDEKKADEVIILDVRGISMITDFYVICTGSSLPHLRAVRKDLAERLWEEHSVKARSLDGQPESSWVIVDFGDVMVHIFLGEKRRLYDLEGLWSDAPRVVVRS